MENIITWRSQITREARSKSRKRNPCPHVSAADRALIDAAVLAGLVTRCPPHFVAPTYQSEMSR